ncbi:hypothetical protein MMC26_003212 [Xylographa opegraphella]|nr:hypothetical protein [Xylographa opegraphella]
MKYGATLQQRSIPEWGTYNVDYNDIKHLIKQRTTRSQGQPISIPGQASAKKASDDFEEELYAELFDQHQRIDLFVQSKSGEIERRLDHLHKQVLNLVHQCETARRKPISVRRLERFSKAETEVLRVGEEIQSLAEFVGVQRLAFRKLLKKYKKWTGSSRLGTRFQDEVLSKPNNFSRKDFGPLLERFTWVLASVRSPFESGFSWNTAGRIQRISTPCPRTSSGSARHPKLTQEATANTSADTTSTTGIYAAYMTGDDVEVDTAFAISPLGNNGGKAAYWIHPDNLVQLHILLLRYSRLRRPGEDSRSSRNSSHSGSRRTSLQSSANSGVVDEAGTIVCDDLQNFAERRNSTTVNDMECVPGTVPEEAAVSIRYSAKGEAIVVINNFAACKAGVNTTGTSISTKKARLRPKLLNQVFADHASSLPPADSSTNITVPMNESYATDGDVEAIRHWLTDHQEVQPLVHLRSSRTRFVGLGNSDSRGIWAILDKSVSMTRSSVDELKDFSHSTSLKDSASEDFPYALLEVRWEETSQPDLVKALDETHLTERVRGFSLATHAVAMLCKPPGMPPPFWIPALNRDIRKLPTPGSLSRRHSTALPRASTPVSPETKSNSATSVTDGPSGSGFSANASLESPLTSVREQLESPHLAMKRKRRTRNEHPLSRQISSSEAPPQRYWNEFDDGDEAPPDEAYTIFVDPNAQSTFPGIASISKLIRTVSNTAIQTSEKVTAWLRPSSKYSSAEHRPLTDDYFNQRPRAEDTDLDSDNSSAENVPQPRRYSTFQANRRSNQSKVVANRESLLLRCCIAFFIASFILLAIAGVLTTTARRRYVRRADIGTLVGMVFSLVFAILGVSMMIISKQSTGLLQRSGLLLVFALICVANAILVMIVIRG